MSVLTAATRKRIPLADFAGPGESYPIEDRTHAGDAKARAKDALDAGKMTRAEYDRIVEMADRRLGPRKRKLGMAA